MTSRTSRRAGLRALGALSLALGISILTIPGASPAWAHNAVVSTTPVEGEALAELPDSFEIRTNDALLDLGGAKSAFVVQDADGLYYGDGCVRIVGVSMFTTAALGPAGEYTVTWQVVSADGHTIDGEYAFTWAPRGSFSPSAGATARPACGGTEEPEPAQEPEGGTPSGSVPSDVWWIGGTAGVVLFAVVATLVATRRSGGTAR